MSFDWQQLFQAAQKMQSDAQRVREELGQRRVEGDSGGGLVRCTANGAGEVLAIALDPSVAVADTPEKKKLVEDLVVGAVNVALDRARELARQEMGRLAGGLPLPPEVLGP